MEKISKIIYAVINTITGSKYIGATTKSLKERKRDHIQKAKKKVGSRFQESIASYPPEAFVWREIDTAETINELAEKEKQYIIKYNAQNLGYNRDRGGGFQKNIYQYDLETGEILSTFSTLLQAANSVGVDRKTISKACLGEIKNCKGFFWSYSLSDNFKPGEDRRNKKVFQFTLDGGYLRNFNSVAEASQNTGINRSSIAKCCRGEYKYAGDYYWNYQKY